MKKIGFLLVTLIILLVSGCKLTIPIQNFIDQPITQIGEHKSSFEDVEKAIVRGAISRGWKADVQENGEIVATLDIRTHQLVVLITHTDSAYSITYVDSTNLKYNGKKIHRQYANWVNNLIASINAMSATQYN